MIVWAIALTGVIGKLLDGAYARLIFVMLSAYYQHMVRIHAARQLSIYVPRPQRVR